MQECNENQLYYARHSSQGNNSNYRRYGKSEVTNGRENGNGKGIISRNGKGSNSNSLSQGLSQWLHPPQSTLFSGSSSDTDLAVAYKAHKSSKKSNYKGKKYDPSEVICYKCSQKGHFANKCGTKAFSSDEIEKFAAVASCDVPSESCFKCSENEIQFMTRT